MESSEVSDAAPIDEQPVTVLPGVDAALAGALAEIGIRSVADLATSRHFALADAIHTGDGDRVRGLSGLLRTSMRERPLADLRTARIDDLEGVGSATAVSFERAGVNSIKDLAELDAWTEAKDTVLGDKPTAIPAPTGNGHRPSPALPSEKRYYDVVVLRPDHIASPDGLVDLELAGGFSLEDAADRARPPVGLMRGLIVSLEQTWTAVGLSKGALLRSVGLAPGEKVNIATIDWSAAYGAGLGESTEQSESLTNLISRERHVNEVARAVAHEAQTGFAESQNKTAVDAYGGSGSGSLGVGAAGSDGDGSAAAGVGVGVGAQANNTRTASQTTGFIAATGMKDLSGTLAQEVIDTTHQAASALRSRYASTLLEVQQGETEHITTRVVRNHNRRHTLNVHYYDAVQVYRTRVAVGRYHDAYLVPIQMVSTWSDEVILEFWESIIALALDPRVATITATLADTIRVRPSHAGQFAPAVWPHQFEAEKRAADLATDSDVAPGSHEVWHLPKSTVLRKVSAIVGAGPGGHFGLAGAGMAFHGHLVVTTDGEEEESDLLTEEVELKFDDGIPIDELVALEVDVNINEPVPPDQELDPVDHEFVEENQYGFRVILEFAFGGKPFEYVKTVSRNELGRNGRTRLFSFDEEQDVGGLPWLKSHLARHSRHYSRGIWQRMDQGQLFAVLSRYHVDGEPLAALVDPVPYGFIGDHIVFRGPQVEPTPRGLPGVPHLAPVGLPLRTSLVPLSTGGIIADGQLGQSVAAELIDHRYFWNWQDSPIPDDAPLIAPVQAGSRAIEIPISTGKLEDPVVRIMQPAALPEPTGLAAALGSMNQSMLSSIGALGSLGDIATAGLNAAATVAGQTGAQASANLGNAMQLAAHMAATAAQAGKPSFGNLNATEFGGLMNAADRAGATNGAGSSDGAASGTGGPGGSAGGGSGGSGPSGGAGTPGSAPTSTGGLSSADVVAASLGHTDPLPIAQSTNGTGGASQTAYAPPGTISRQPSSEPSPAQQQATADTRTVLDAAAEREGTIDDQAIDELAEILVAWHDDAVQPLAALAKTDDVHLMSAIREFLEWLTAAMQFGIEDLEQIAGRRAAVEDALRAGLDHAVVMVGVRIAATGDVGYLHDLIAWTEAAQSYPAIAGFASLDEAVDIAGGRVEVLPFEVPLLDVGESAELSITARLLFDDVALTSELIEVACTAEAATVDPAAVVPLSAGTARPVLTRDAADSVSVTAHASWTWSGVIMLEDERTDSMATP